MFAWRRSSSLSYDKFSCLDIALLSCCLLVVLGNVQSMSLDRLGAARQYQQQNDKQLEFSEFMLPEAESEYLQNDMELMPAIDGHSDMYLLVPAVSSQQQAEEQNLQDQAAQQQQMSSESNGILENNSDMLMLESDDTPAVQILELPADVLETKIVEQNENDAEELQISDNEMNNLAEAVQEIQNEIETELLEQTSEEQSASQEIQQVMEENVKDQETNELSAEHKDLELSANIANASEEKSSLEEDSNSEQEMIGVVMEEPENNNAANPVMDLKAEESEVQPAVMELNNETQNQIIEQVSEILQENKKVDELPAETQNDDETVAEIEKNDNVEENQNDEVAEEIKQEITEAQVVANEAPDSFDDETKTTAEAQSENAEVNKPDTEVDAINEIQADDELQVAVDSSMENQDAVEQQQETEQTEIFEEAADEKLASVEETQVQEETEKEAKPAEESMENMEMVAESQIAEDAETTEQPLKNKEESEPMQQATEEMEEIISVDETQQDDEVNQVVNQMQNDEELSAVVENQAVEESQTLEQAEPVEETQADQTVEETQHFEPALPLEEVKDEEEFQPTKEIETVKEDQPIKEIQILKEDNKEEIQSVEDAQPIVVSETTEDASQPMEEVQPMLEAQVAEDGQITEEPIEEAQAIVEEMIPVLNDDQLVEEVQTQTEEEVKPLQEAEVIEEIQPVEEMQAVETTEANLSEEKVMQEEETQTAEEIQADEDSQDSNIDQILTEEAKPSETVAVTESPVEETKSTDKPTGQFESEEAPIAPELNIPVQDEEIPAEINANEAVNEDNLNKETTSVAEENQETPVEIFPDDLIDNETKDTENEEAHSIVLADEDVLQNVDTLNEYQTVKQEETAAVAIQNPLEEKDNDNILNDDTNEIEINKETTSMLTAIVQVPTKEELTQQQAQQQAEIVETTLKPINVLDSVLNYVNASFMSQMNNDNSNNNINDDFKQDDKEDEQAFSSKLRRYDGAQVWRIVVQNDREKKLADELQTKYDGQLWKEVKQEVDYLLKPHVLADAERHVKAANLTRIVLIDNLQKVIEVENPPAEEIAQLQNRKGHRLTWQAYHRLEDIHGFFDYLAKTYPDICSVETIGYSIEKRPLKILKISNGNANNPGIWIDGGIHAREWISPAVVTYIANQVVEGWDDLPAYMRNINWYIHAVANPDGYEYSHTTDRLWRKNMRSHGRVCPGVDLNRNFGYKWGGKGTSANPCAQTYRGSKAFSEPETFYISKFISNFPRETFKAYLSFHSYGQYILYPWGYDYHVTKDMADLDLVARQAGTIITKSTGVKYTVGSSANTLYPAAGGSDDWAKGIAGIKYSYTIEMGDTGRYGFVLPADHIEPNGKNGFTFVGTVAKAITMGKNARRRKLKANKTH